MKAIRQSVGCAVTSCLLNFVTAICARFIVNINATAIVIGASVLSDWTMTQSTKQRAHSPLPASQLEQLQARNIASRPQEPAISKPLDMCSC